MASYAKKFQWDLDPIDFELQDFYPSGKTIPERYRQERRRKPQLDQVSRAMPTSNSSSSSNAMKKKKETVVKSSDKSRGDHNKRLIGWNVDLLERMLRQIQAHRQAEGVEVTSLDNFVIHQRQTIANTIDPRNNVCKIIPFPPFDKQESIRKVNPNTIELDPNVRDQLAEYVTFIASHYRHELAYHNFNHASNVATFANKLLQRIVDESLTRSLTHPLVQFSVILAALIHDMDHVGESNKVFENTIVDLYDGKSVAEQNSIDKAWSELMDPNKYQQLRMAICANPTESQRFRNLLVNMVMATDMFDEELILDRDTRWELAFGDYSTENSNTYQGDEALGEDDNDDKNGIRSTILVEHILQASNIGHAMQPLHGFKRWNERLFLESWQVLADSNPSEQNALISQWYENQLRFFGNYVIPLAARLNNCGKFGNAGADLLACAQSNRKEWEETGEKVVREFVNNITP